jgi:hypothetical protein
MNLRTNTETYENFLGIDNINDHTKIIKRVKGVPFIHLLQATNVDIHADSHISRCAGYSLKLSGAYKSVWADDDICLGILNSNLYQIYPDFSASLLLRNVGANPMAYSTIPGAPYPITYFTNSSVIGKVVNGVASLLAPTTSSDNAQFKLPLPSGNMLGYFKGSLCVISDRVIYVSDIINREMFDRRYGYRQLASTITMFQPVYDGIWVSDSENVYFMKHTGTPENLATPMFDSIKVYNKPTVPGTPQLLFDKTFPSGAKSSHAVIWVSDKTICIGGNNGHFETINSDIYALPTSLTGTSIYRESGDLKQYITVVKE